MSDALGGEPRQQSTKRRKYQSDPEYREKVRNNSFIKWVMGERGRVERRISKMKVKSADYTKSITSGRTRKTNPKKIQTDSGEIILVYPIIHLSARLGIERQILRRYLSKHIIPQPTFTDSSGRNWFSEDYINNLCSVFIDIKAKNWSLDHLKIALREALPKAKWID